ncbi:VOC family protein [Glycomyces dulcitolivorans]|uniref:VOC family protein n=1 Tax=Glycomyces dulcitolivorans TaxID=2200759 RepID=UPI000DD45714|nr:VOC family protein [Glycomyces dulcitolivorans]
MADIALGAPIWADSLTSDLRADTAFFEGLFGWSSEDAGEEFGNYTTFSLPGAEPRPVMGIMPAPPGMAPSKTLHLQFKVGSCDASVGEARRLGASLDAGPEDVGGMLRFAMLSDPNGASFGVVEALDPATGFGAWGEPNAIAWAEYHFDGVPAEAMRFYQELLGWNVDVPPWEDPANPRPYASLSPGGGGAEFGGCHAAESFEKGIPSQWSVMVAVGDADAVAARARDLGGTVAAEPMDVPGLRIAGVAAPSGTVVGVHSPREWG